MPNWNENKKVRVVLADDHAMVREGLAQLLEDSKGILVVGQAADGIAALDLVRKEDPDVAVLDYSMPNMDAVSATQQISRHHSRTRILVLTVHENVHYAIKVLQAGAHGFLIKAAAVEELVKAIRIVAEGKVYVSPAISEKMAETFQKGPSSRSGLSSLSVREFELLRMLGSGMRLQDCAKAMKVRESTASTYRSRLMNKLNLKSTPEIIRFALENEIVG
ncbi:MAG TPA: response regulator transcription factor [Acidobacteriota bacterium]|nr:response regulator transcription factor [Acidobacteriota bacterium]